MAATKLNFAGRSLSESDRTSAAAAAAAASVRKEGREALRSRPTVCLRHVLWRHRFDENDSIGSREEPESQKNRGSKTDADQGLNRGRDISPSYLLLSVVTICRRI